MKQTTALKIMISAAMAMAAMAGCSRNGTRNGDEQTDSIAADTGEVKEVERIVEKPRLHFATPEDAMQYMDESPDHDAYAAGILYRMAADTLDYCERLLNNQFRHFIIVDKGKMRVELYDKFGRLEKSYRCACGRNYGNKRQKGDCRTPEGFFRAGGVKNSSDWHYTDENGNRSEKPGQYGPRFVRIVTPGYSSTGIHGTDAPWSVGGRRSHGCVRLKNEDILQLAEYVEKGMPIIVKPGPKDAEVNWREEHPWETAETEADTVSTDGISRHEEKAHAATTDTAKVRKEKEE